MKRGEPMQKKRFLLNIVVSGALLLVSGIGLCSLPSLVAAETVTQNRSIIDEDNRTEVTETTTAPYASMTYIKTGKSWGSGAVIGKNTVLTAGHIADNIVDDFASENIYVAPGRSGAKYPYGKFKITAIHFPEEYAADPNSDSDLAVINIAPNAAGESIGDVVTPLALKVTNHAEIGTPITVTGYPQDKAHATMWTDTGRVVQHLGKRLFHDADTIGGQSGSPIYNNQHEIIAVHTNGNANNDYGNYGAIINDKHYQFIQAHMK